MREVAPTRARTMEMRKRSKQKLLKGSDLGLNQHQRVPSPQGSAPRTSLIFWMVLAGREV